MEARGQKRRGGGRLESGGMFMPDVNEKRLERVARREKDARAKLRLIACRDRKGGHRIRRISRDLGTAYSTVRDWLVRMSERGLKGRFNRRPGGRRSRFMLSMLRAVRGWLRQSPQKYGFESGSWQLDMIIEMIRREFGTGVKARTLRRWLRRIRFSWRKDRHVPRRSASRKRQGEFKSEVGERAGQRRAAGRTVFAEDEASVQIEQNPAYWWRPTGGCEETKIGFSRRAVRIFGAMPEDELRIKVVDPTNSQTFREFLGEIAGTSRGFSWSLTTRPTTNRRRPENTWSLRDGNLRSERVQINKPKLAHGSKWKTDELQGTLFTGTRRNQKTDC